MSAALFGAISKKAVLLSKQDCLNNDYCHI